jgi:type I restriction enzyme, S subunit
MSFPRYERYKDSGVEWLGEVPEHWGVSRLGFESWVRARLGWKGLKAEEYVDEGYVFLSTPNIKGRNIDFENVNYINEHRYEESAEIKLLVGDVLLAKDGSTLGTVNLVRSLPRPATVNSSIAVITPNKSLDGAFLYYLFQSSYIEQTIQRIKGGMGVPHLFQADLNKFYIPMPTLAEQKNVADVLDRGTAKIDALITEQQRLIEVLKEKRQAVISHAVTKGLNPAAPMKDSGIEWLGGMPRHWKLRPLKHLASFRSGGTPDKSRPEFWDGGVPWASAKDLKVEALNDTEDHITNEALDAGEASLVAPGSLLIVVRGMILARTFPVVRTNVAMAINQDLKAVIPRTEMSTGYLAWLLRGSEPAILSNLDEAAHGTKALRMERWGSMLLPVPPLDEQVEISTYVEKICASVAQLSKSTDDAIGLLQERRTAIISAAVTGKIDVRGLAKDAAA